MEKEPEGRDIYFTQYDNLIPVETLLGLDTPDKLLRGRDSGRTFRRMLLTLHAASANPGHWIQIKDHEYGNDRFLGNCIEKFLEKSDMAYFFQFTESFSKGGLVPNYYIRFRTPSYKNSPYIY